MYLHSFYVFSLSFCSSYLDIFCIDFFHTPFFCLFLLLKNFCNNVALVAATFLCLFQDILLLLLYHFLSDNNFVSIVPNFLLFFYTKRFIINSYNMKKHLIFFHCNKCIISKTRRLLHQIMKTIIYV